MDMLTGNSEQLLPRFETETIVAAASVREALGALVSEIPGEIRKPRELQRVLGVDYKICWQVFNVIQAGDPLKAAKFTPSAPALKRFLASSLSIGINASRVEAVQSAIDQFTSVVRKHAEDRSTFQAMVSAASEGDDAAAELPHRRAAYRAMSHIWGAQVESHLSLNFVRRSSSGDRLDECSIAIKRGFHRLRTTASPIVSGSRPSVEEAPPSQFIRQPLDVEAAKKYQAPILPLFSSRPLPKLRTEPGGGGWVHTKLAEEGIGRQSRVNLAFGMGTIGLPVSFDADGRRLFRSGAVFRTPTGLLVMDVLVHRQSFPNIDPEAVAFQSMPGEENPVVAKEAPQLPVHERIAMLGSAHLASDTPDWPDYSKALRYAAEKMKWDLAEFDIFRLRMEYPVIGAVVRLQFHFE
jgi:hypothetical protein